MTSAEYGSRGGSTPVTGDPAAPISAELAELRHRPLTEHAAAFERIHERLTSSLAAIDTA